jgi:hypothetical protein
MKEATPGKPTLHNETAIPEELLVDYQTNRFGLRAAIWRKLGNNPELIAKIKDSEFHLVGRVIPTGRVLLFGGAGVLAIAGTGGAIVMCKHLYKHDKEHQKLHKKVKFKAKKNP